MELINQILTLRNLRIFYILFPPIREWLRIVNTIEDLFSKSMYLKVPVFQVFFVNIGKNISFPRFQIQLSCTLKGISSSIQFFFPFNFP